MTTKLERLLDSLDPSRNLDQVSARVDRAINSLRLPSGAISRWEDFQEVMTHFYCHVENMILCVERSPFPDADWPRCLEQLRKAYGSSGEKTAFEIARTGLEGGLYAVLKNVAARMMEKYSGNEISARINQFWNDLSNAERFAVMDEYLAKYGHLLPSEMTEGSAARLRANFTKVLVQHPHLIRGLRTTLR